MEINPIFVVLIIFATLLLQMSSISSSPVADPETVVEEVLT